MLWTYYRLYGDQRVDSAASGSRRDSSNPVTLLAFIGERQGYIAQRENFLLTEQLWQLGVQ